MARFFKEKDDELKLEDSSPSLILTDPPLYPKQQDSAQILKLTQFSNLKKFCVENIPTLITISQYRILNCNSYSKQLKKLTESSEATIENFDEILPLLLYHLNCNLPFEDLLERLNLDDSVLESSIEMFQVLFQNSETILKAMYVYYFSFSNPIPFYFPVIDFYSENQIVDFTLCKELWYSLTPHNAVLSFGLGSAANGEMGKSTLLDQMFELNFSDNNPPTSCFHSGSIDLRLTKNFFPGEDCEKYFTDWAFFDCHTPTPMGMVNLLLKHVNIVIVHVLESDVENNLTQIEQELRSMDLRKKDVFVLIRDATSTKEENIIFDRNIYNQINIPSLIGRKKKNNSLKKELKRVGKGIIQLGTTMSKFTSNNLEKLLKDYDESLWNEIESKNTLIQTIKDNITNKRSKEGINFEFLNYYPTFVNLMKKKYQLSSEEKQEKVEKMNAECTKCFEELKNTEMCSTNEIFRRIIIDKDSILILWKLAQELQQLSFNLQTPLNNEQANDKYSIEILWREAVLTHKYSNPKSTKSNQEYFDNLSRSMSNGVLNGEPFELIDGDNLVFFSKELNSMLRHFHVEQTDFVQRYNKGPVKITEAPIVLSIIGPQSSGKSTLLNYVFGCKFLTSSGRCTRGVYGSVMELSEPIDDSKFFLIIDTEGIEAAERKNISNASNIHFDRSLILFCLSVSNIVIINLPGEITTNMQELLKICAFSLNQLKVKRATLPKIIFVLNKIADPNLNNRKIALKILVDCLDNEIPDSQETESVKISDQIKLTEEDLFTLPSAYDIASIDSPNYEIFEKSVIKQTPTLHFALECSKLKESIFKKLQHTSQSDRPSFTSMSEWLEMAGGTWNTIITFQDIVKFNSLKEIQLHQQLKKIVDELMKENFYSKKEEFNKRIKQYSNEIFESKSLNSADLKDEINKKTEDFIRQFDATRVETILKYTELASSLGNCSNLIQREFKEHLGRLISTELLNYKIILESRTNEIFMQRRRLEYFAEFKKEITSDPVKFIGLSNVELEKEFERLWLKKIEKNDLDEIYRQQNLIDFYLTFTNEWSLINQRDILQIYSDHKYESENVIKFLETKVITGLTSSNKTEEPYFYPAKKCLPLKDIQPHFYSRNLEYLTESKFYYVHSTEGQESKYIKYFPNNKAIYKQKWVPDDCVPLLQSCSGYYPNYDINWGNLSPSNQISKLVEALLAQDMSKSIQFSKRVTFPQVQNIGRSPKILKDLHSDSCKFIQKDPEINPITIKLIADAIKKRITIFNHEISHIGGELTIFANRDIGSYIFSLAFQSYHREKWQIYLDNRKKITDEKQNLKNYFTTKVEISKIILVNKDSIASSSSKYDSNISGKYAKAFIENLSNKAIHALPDCTLERLKNKRELFLYESLSTEATKMVQEAIDKGTSCDRELRAFLVQYYCERNDALRSVFEKRWKEFIEFNREGIITEVTKSQQGHIDELLEQLGKILIFLEKEDISLFHADKIFENLDNQNKEIDSFQMNESPFRVLTLFLSRLMNPAYKSAEIKDYFSKEFIIEGIRMRTKNDIVLNNELLDCFIISEYLFSILKMTNMFDSELTFNLYNYLANLKQTVETTRIVILNSKFKESVNYIYGDLLNNSLGCTNQCPCCRKFCEEKYHKTGSCTTSGHQFASMGGKAWRNDKEHSALFLRCEDYKDEMVVALPGRLIKWGDFKDSSRKQWNWDQDFRNDISEEENSSRKSRLIKVWDTFGKEILEYHHSKKGAKIAFRPYEENNLELETLEILKFQICFVIDGTGSMARDIQKVRASVHSLIESYKKSNKLIEFRIIIYRDHCDEKVLEQFPSDNSFCKREEEIDTFLDEIITEGGGDVPEASKDGLASSLLADWDRNDKARRIVIHIFDAPPHGNFPDYRQHNNNSNPDHCCCCSGLCPYDWNKDVWDKFKEKDIEYHGINTGDSNWLQFEHTMSKKLDYLCKGFTKCGKEQVNDAVMQIFINFQPCTNVESDDDDTTTS